MHVVVTDADSATARSIEAVMAGVGHEVMHASCATDALRIIVDGTDAVILDTDLPDHSGVDLCRELRAHRYTGIIIFVARDDEAHTKVTALRAGADDYLVKPFDPQELLARLDTIAGRTRQPDIPSEGPVVKSGLVELSLRDLTYQRPGQEPVLLTPTELRVLEILMRYAGVTVSRDTLIEQVWGVNFEGDTNRLDVFIRRLRQKIEPTPEQPAYLHTVWGTGYVFTPPDTDVVPERPSRS